MTWKFMGCILSKTQKTAMERAGTVTGVVVVGSQPTFRGLATYRSVLEFIRGTALANVKTLLGPTNFCDRVKHALNVSKQAAELPKFSRNTHNHCNKVSIKENRDHLMC